MAAAFFDMATLAGAARACVSSADLRDAHLDVEDLRSGQALDEPLWVAWTPPSRMDDTAD